MFKSFDQHLFQGFKVSKFWAKNKLSMEDDSPSNEFVSWETKGDNQFQFLISIVGSIQPIH
jgi:hypothetical protein